MKIIKTVKELRDVLKGKSTGLVPTMGALHEGHMSLISRCVKENECTVVSIFVNPTQFGVNEDFDKYPRTLEADAKMCEGAGVDFVFAPSASEMYPSGTSDLTLVCPPYSLLDRLCGKSRVGHFDGVASVVLKLFNIVRPKRAYFGQKDAQQLFVISKMVEDLNVDVEIVPCDIVREADGLAMSSRNVYLSKKGREEGVRLSKALFTVREMVQKGESDTKVLTDAALSVLEGLDVEYFEIYDLNSFEETDTIKESALALVAASIREGENKVRLIDNARVK